MSKLDELKAISEEETPDLICCVETWLDNSHKPKEIEIENFRCISRIRSKKPNRGGVCIYYRKGLKMEEIAIPKHKLPCKCEAIWTKIIDERGKKMVLATVYRSPTNANFLEHIEEDMDYISQLNLPVIIVGDFNIDLLTETPSKRTLMDVFNRQCMEQMIQQPTRITSDTRTLIDHIWTNDKDFIKDLEVNHGLSDHHMCNFKIEIQFIPQQKEKFKFRRIDRNADKIAKDLEEYDWEFLMNTNNSELAWRNMKSTILKAMNKYAPEIESKKKIDKPWMNAELLELTRKKKAMQIRRAGPGGVDEREWKETKNAVKKLSWKLKKDHYSRRIEENKGNPNKLWKIIKDIAPSNVGHTKQDIELDISMVNKFNNHFVDTGRRIQQEIAKEIEESKQETQKQGKDETNHSTDLLIGEIRRATVEDTVKIINKIDANKATGIDEIPIKVIKAATTALAKPISTLMNIIFNTGLIPQEFKTAMVTATFKNGDRTKVDNYRPLSILPATSKIMEYYIKDQLYDYLETNNLITDTQHAYRTGHSTTTCLLKLTEDVRMGMDEGKATGILAIDLSKAFDVIDHEILMTKLCKIGVTGKLLDFIRDYLRGRLQCVKCKDNVSDKKK